MIIRRSFKYLTSRISNNGDSGWAPAWMGNPDSFDPGQGVTVAHDFMEHRACDTGKWNEEMMAFGAMIFTRVLPGYFDIGSKRLGEELHGLWDQHVRSVERSLPKHNRLPKLDTRVRDVIEEMTDGFYGEDQEQSEWRSRQHNHWTGEKLAEDKVPLHTKEDMEVVRQWLAEGFHQASIRYARLGMDGAKSAFGHIEHDYGFIRRAYGMYEEMVDYEGRDVRLVIELDDRFGNTPEVHARVWCSGPKLLD